MRIISCLILLCSLIFACNNSTTEKKNKPTKPIVYKEVEPSQSYESCKIGGQTWMAQNLNEPHFKNGDPIKQAQTKEEWKKAANTCTPAWCYYENDPSIGAKFGKLYNWYAVNDPRGLAPKGWRLPNNAAWLKLRKTLISMDKDAMALQHASFIGELEDADALHFHAYGSGYRTENAAFKGKDQYASYWSQDTANTYSANAVYLRKYEFELLLGAYYKSGGFSVRCIKN